MVYPNTTRLTPDGLPNTVSPSGPLRHLIPRNDVVITPQPTGAPSGPSTCVWSHKQWSTEFGEQEGDDERPNRVDTATMFTDEDRSVLYPQRCQLNSNNIGEPDAQNPGYLPAKGIRA